MRTLVSNAAQTGDDSANTSGNKHAQLFHTGGNTAGYTLRSVIVNSDDPENDAFDVEVCEADTTANEFPTSTCTALTAPGSFVGVGNVIFTHTGLALSANTNYVVVITQRTTASVEIDSTTSGGEDSTGLSDWSIKDKFYWRSGVTWMLKSGSDEALSILVRGYVNTDTTPPALVSATVVDGGDEIALVFDELIEILAAASLPSARFSVTVDGSPATFTQYGLQQGLSNHEQINLDEIDPDIRSGQTVIITYTDPAGDDVSPMALHDLAGNDVASFTTGSAGVPAVINNLPPPPPEVSSVALTSAPGSDNTYAIGGEDVSGIDKGRDQVVQGLSRSSEGGVIRRGRRRRAALGCTRCGGGFCFPGFTLKKGLASRRLGLVLGPFWVLVYLFTGLVAPTTCSLTTCLTTCTVIPFRRSFGLSVIPFRRIFGTFGDPV